jgi:hypothetical protein
MASGTSASHPSDCTSVVDRLLRVVSPLELVPDRLLAAGRDHQQGDHSENGEQQGREGNQASSKRGSSSVHQGASVAGASAAVLRVPYLTRPLRSLAYLIHAPALHLAHWVHAATGLRLADVTAERRPR